MSVKKRLRNSGNKYGFAIKLLFVGRQHDTPFFLSKININLLKNDKNILQFNYNHAILYSTKQEAAAYAPRKVWRTYEEGNGSMDYEVFTGFYVFCRNCGDSDITMVDKMDRQNVSI